MSKHTPGPKITAEGFQDGGFERVFVNGVQTDLRLLGAAKDFHSALDRIMLKAVRQQAAGGDLHDFQDRLRECAAIARADIARATGAAS